MLKRLLISSLVLLGCLVFALAAWLYWQLNQPLNLAKLAVQNSYQEDKQQNQQKVEIELQPGQSFLSLINTLSRQEVIASSLPMRIWLKLFASNQPIHQGEYVLTPPLTQLQLLKLLQAGKVKTYEFRLIEGTNFQQLKQQLANTPQLKLTLLKLSDAEIMQQLGAAELSALQPAEGWFFPATYTYSKNTSDFSLLTQAYKKMQQHLNEVWLEAKTKNLPYSSPYQLLIMASLIEKETGVPYERPDIAGVFVRRLEQRMRLQTDPTVIYGMQENYKGRITYKDLRTPTPWNTYTNNGLPPTPIAMPGLAALKAAANPAAGTALYFVAKGDGSHQFSDTLEEHNQAVKRYQLNRKADYRSSPTNN